MVSSGPRIGDQGVHGQQSGKEEEKEGGRGAAGAAFISFAREWSSSPPRSRASCTPRSGSRRRSPRSALGPKGWTIGAAFQAAELYDGVIFTAPAHRIDEIDLDFPGGDRLKTLGSITYPAVAVVALGFRREDVAHPLDGFGLLVPEVERRHVLGVIFSSTLFPGRAPEGHVMLTAFVGGVRNPDLANADVHTITARVLDDLRLLLGAKGEPTFRAFHLWSKAIPQYDLTYSRFKEIMDEAERRNPGSRWRGRTVKACGGRRDRRGEAAAARLAEHLCRGGRG